jgi:biopolymer transport protein ExbD
MKPSHSQESADGVTLNLTPLIDMVFILLIFFMVNSTFVRETGVTVERPAARTAVLQERGNILIAVTASGEVWMEQQRIDAHAVRARIERLHAEHPEGAAIVIADRQAPTGSVVQVLDQARLAGVGQVSIATDEPPR